MQASRGLRVGGLAAVVLVLGAGVAAPASATDTSAEALGYFAGHWFCSGTATTADGNSITAVGTLTYHPWQAWYVTTWEAGDGSAASLLPWLPQNANNWHWPAHGGHGPVIPPSPNGSGSVPSVPLQALMMSGYDTVAQSFVTFKFLPSGTYYQATSDGPTANTWVWSGAVSDAGGGTGASFEATVDASNPSTFSTVTRLSTDLGQTWTEHAKTQCYRK